MQDNIINNKFNPYTTKILLIHDGRFHADDMMFAALAQIAAEKCGKDLIIKRVHDVPKEYSNNIVAGDIGYGIYDHHNDGKGNCSLGCSKNNENRTVSACGLLYDELKNFLFKGKSESKQLFGALIDIIEHCDNTSDNNTFSDSIGFLASIDDSKCEEASIVAINYCKAIINGFITTHNKECSGKVWAAPCINKNIVPGIKEKRADRYWKASVQTKAKYKYISFNDASDIKLKSIDTYAVICSVLPYAKREYWQNIINESDAKQIKELEKREAEIWPIAVSQMTNKTIYLDKYISYGQHAKEIDALFIVMPSQRGGYNLHFIKTNNNKFRFNPDLIIKQDGCVFMANDKRFLSFETKDQALSAAHMAGKMAENYLSNGGIEAYRHIYGGFENGYSNDFFRDLIGENIALNMFIKNNIKNVNKLSVEDYRKIQIAVADNPYLIHCFCVCFDNSGENMKWLVNKSVVDIPALSKDTLIKTTMNGRSWDIGLVDFLHTKEGLSLCEKIIPREKPSFV